MPRLEFTTRATEDLREIGRYTKRQWGIQQARTYRQELELALRKLSLSPRAGLVRDEIADQVRSFQVASHIAFYLPRTDGITVLRVLHPSMDVERAFGREQEQEHER